MRSRRDSGLVRALIAFDREREAERDVFLSRAILVAEHGKRWTKDDFFRVIGRAPGVIYCNVDHELEATFETCWRQPERLGVVVLEERAKGYPALATGMPKDRLDKNLQLMAVGFQ